MILRCVLCVVRSRRQRKKRALVARVWLAALIAACFSLNGARAQEVTAKCPDDANIRAGASGDRTQWVLHLEPSESESVGLFIVEDGTGRFRDFVVLDGQLTSSAALGGGYMLVALFDDERSEQLAASIEQLTDHSW